jgi:hypothetical protein
MRGFALRRALGGHSLQRGESVAHQELTTLLIQARAVLDRYLFEGDGETIRDDVAEVCMAIDDALPTEGRVQLKQTSLERSAA